ncbi:hypothetical protein V6R21_19560 [Limibacter armeniacum]|uniref:hypothetical protein n=1 Tax=Limibacter armeniacum TaxID=466084 RepID=UPI002FE526C8
MKYFFLIISSLLLTISLQAQNVYTVSNNVRIPAQFTDLQEAIDQAPAGSMIYVHPSSVSYGDVTIAKNLKLLGGGYIGTDEFFGEKTQIGSVTVSETTSDVTIANNYIERLFSKSVSGDTDQQFGKLTIEFNYIGIIEFTALDATAYAIEADIRNNIINRISLETPSVLGKSAIYNIENNVIGYATGLQTQATALINNLFYPSNESVPALVNISDAAIINNIFFAQNANTNNDIGLANVTNCVITNNLCVGTRDIFSSGSDETNSYVDNINQQDPQFTTVSYRADLYEWVTTSNFTLKSTSPALTAGQQGDALGIMGGNYPYNPRGRYMMPYIQSISIDKPVVESDKQIRVTIKAGYPGEEQQ